MPSDLNPLDALTLAILHAARAAGRILTAEDLQAAVRELLELAAEIGMPLGYIAEAIGAPVTRRRAVLYCFVHVPSAG
jgi:hypothetical protein